MIDYLPLRVLMAKRRLKQKDIMALSGISKGTMAKISRDEYVAMEVIDRICEALDCNIEEVVRRISAVTDKEQGGAEYAGGKQETI